MRRIRSIFPVIGLALVFQLAATSALAERVSTATVNQVLSGWPDKPHDAATKMIAKYGPPDEFTPSTLTWMNNGPWKRTTIYRQEVRHDFPKTHTDFVEQFIDYRVPPEQFDALAAYDGSVIVERTKGEISARCDKEEMNFLALNLANDIVTGTKTVDQARRFYADTAMADRDVTIIPESVLSSMPPPPPDEPGASIRIDPNRVQVTRSLVDQILASWSSHPREAATKLIDKYGLPSEATASALTWFNNGTWKRTIVYRDEVAHDFPKRHTDFVEQFVDYRVPVEKFDELAAYDGSVIVERTKGEISARCDKEEMNFLALNLANDVVNGTKTVEQARQFYADTAVAAMKGEKPAYISGLRFTRATQTADRDVTTIPQAMLSSMSETGSQPADEPSRPRRRMPKD